MIQSAESEAVVTRGPRRTSSRLPTSKSFLYGVSDFKGRGWGCFLVGISRYQDFPVPRLTKGRDHRREGGLVRGPSVLSSFRPTINPGQRHSDTGFEPRRG